MKKGIENTAVINKGLHVPTNRIVTIEQIALDKKGLKCECICIECNERLEACKGEVYTDYFRHASASSCKGGQETALHQLAKQIIVENLVIVIPKHGSITLTSATAEKELISKRPDVTADYEALPIYFEIAVKHFIEPDKLSFFKDGKYRSIEIDLSKIAPTAPIEEIEYAVLKEVKNKKILYWEPEIVSNHEPVKRGSPNPIAIFAFLVFLGICANELYKRHLGKRKRK